MRSHAEKVRFGRVAELLGSKVLLAFVFQQALVSEPEDHIKAACAWSLGQIGRHTPDHARALAEGDVLRHLLVRIPRRT